MNNRPVEQALATLLPTHANDLPQELLSLSLSLVAQSRSFSTSLRPEEEIARPYACAEIACRRLSRALKLPPLLGRPPCPPTAYKKLFAFLDRSLASNTIPKRSGSASASGTPRTTRTHPSTPAKESPTPATKATRQQRPEAETPSKATPLKRTRTPSNANGTPQRKRSPKLRRNGLSSTSSIPDAPAWVMASIRTVCKTLSTPAPRTNTFSRPPISKTLPPHIFAGVSSVLHFIGTSFEDNIEEELDEETLEFLDPVLSVKDTDKDEDFKEVVSALIVAVYFLVLARRRNSGSEDAEGQQEERKMDKKTFSEMRQTALVCLGLSAERRHRDDVDLWIALIMEQGWVGGMEWFENIPLAGEVDGDEAYLSGGGEDEGGDGVEKKMTAGLGALLAKDANRGGLLPGLGTMMQDRVDWLSEDRKEDYLEWKDDILGRIERMERTGQVAT